MKNKPTFEIGDMLVYQPNVVWPNETFCSTAFFYVIVEKTRINYILMSLTTGDDYIVDINDCSHYKKVS